MDLTEKNADLGYSFNESDELKGFNQIEENLYLGSYLAVTNVKTINELKIKRVLTVMDYEIPNKDRQKDIDYKYIEADDDEDQDLLSDFPETNEYISLGQKSGQNVFVHCMIGVSRSATIVIAFIMNKYNKSFKDSLKLVASKRRLIGPNMGFREQLVLYEQMNFTLDANNRKFRQFLVKKHVKKYSRNKFIDRYFEKLSNAEKITPNLALGQVFNCAKCGFKLFNEINVIKNEDQKGQKGCDSIYIEPQKWMKELYEGMEASQTVKCPQCKEVVVKFNKFFRIFTCNCVLHAGINCLKFQMQDKMFKIQTNK